MLNDIVAELEKRGLIYFIYVLLGSIFDKYQVSFPDVYEIQLRNSWDFRNHIFLKSQLFFIWENGLASHRHS